MTLKDALLCVGFSLALPAGQSLFKLAVIQNERMTGPLLLRMMTNPALIGAFAWYALTAVFWFYVLTRVPLSQAYAFSIMGSGLIPLIAWLVFKEDVTWQMGAGYALMLAGLLLTLQGGKAQV